MTLRPSLIRSLADHTRAVVATANGAPVDLVATAHDGLRAAGRNPETCSRPVRASALDVVEACIYALGGEVQS